MIDYGHSPAQLQILDDICDAKNTAKTELVKSRRERHAARPGEYRKRDRARVCTFTGLFLDVLRQPDTNSSTFSQYTAVTSAPVAEGSNLDVIILRVRPLSSFDYFCQCLLPSPLFCIFKEQDAHNDDEEHVEPVPDDP